MLQQMVMMVMMMDVVSDDEHAAGGFLNPYQLRDHREGRDTHCLRQRHPSGLRLNTMTAP